MVVATLRRGTHRAEQDVPPRGRGGTNHDAEQLPGRPASGIPPGRSRAGLLDSRKPPRDVTARRAVLIGGGLGSWLGALTGLVPAVLLPAVTVLPMLLVGLAAGAVAGAVLGLIVHGGTAGNDRTFRTSRRAAGTVPWCPAETPSRRHSGVERTPLPKVGVAYALVTADGRRVGVVAHRSGRRDLISYDPNDPDRVQHAMVLTETEAWTVAQLLGMPVLVTAVCGGAHPDRARHPGSAHTSSGASIGR